MKGVKTIQTRVEQQVLKENNPFYPMILGFTHDAKNLYNHANYVIRQEFINNGKYLKYGEVDKLLRQDKEYPDYRNMPTAQSAQQLLRRLNENWVSFFVAIKDWKKNPSKYLGRPKLPKYKKKDGYITFGLTYQECKIKEDKLIHFPKTFKGFTVKPRCIEREDFASFQQIRFVPEKHKIIVEIIYNIKDTDAKPNNNRYIGIDIGVNNLAAVANNVGIEPFLINGRPLKAINAYYNRHRAYYESVAMSKNKRYFTNKMSRIANNRTARIDDYMHKASRQIINFCEENNINTIIIGKNKGWKVESDMDKKHNQPFVQIPFARFIEMIQYKAKEKGITVILVEESYTSGTSYIDNETPTKGYYNYSRRESRGMFLSNGKIKINADLNGAYQIIKKAVPSLQYEKDRDYLQPVKINIPYITRQKKRDNSKYKPTSCKRPNNKYNRYKRLKQEQLEREQLEKQLA